MGYDCNFVNGILLQGIGFVDCMNDVCIRRKVDPTLVESDSIKWVLLLLRLVNFTDDKVEIYLRQFLMSRSKVLKSQKCRQEIKKYVSGGCMCILFMLPSCSG